MDLRLASIICCCLVVGATAVVFVLKPSTAAMLVGCSDTFSGILGTVSLSMSACHDVTSYLEHAEHHCMING